MTTRYDILIEAQATVGGSLAREDDKQRLVRLLNKTLVSMSEQHSFQRLRRTMIVDLADASETVGQEGTWLPANCAGVDAVQDVESGEYFIRREMDAIGNVEFRMPRYSVYSPGLQPAFWADDLIINKGATTFSSIKLDDDGEDYTGEYIMLGNEPMYYELTGERTIGQTYWGESINNGDLTIRPPIQNKLVIHTDHDTQVLTGEVKIHYWIYHPLMFRDSDILMFPYPRLVELIMQKEAKGSLSRRSRDPLNLEIEDAWKEARRLNPAFYIPPNPLDRVGNNYDPTSLTFVQRGGRSSRVTRVEDWR